MKIKFPAFIAKLFRSSPAQEVADIVITEAQQVIALLMALPIAAVVRDDIRTIANDSLSGQQKFDVVLGRTLPVLLDLLTAKGLNVAAKDIEDIGRGFVQAVYNEFASTRAGTIAKLILKLFNFA
ncbi:hypothetical protein [Sphingomonas sp. RIT328]|uniref:hypothetical protein n=1 Tax=Sphingomonas sp. RIT328 TaxID=1470591 RepID=UPI0004466579|nr:hypothetical protein [Sphingomonas sp. RIT328]EZP57269.1 hypothetical protein BW41_00112 [Sphingomonas sp. RIT328]